MGIVTLALAFTLGISLAHAETVDWISTDKTDAQADGASSDSDISADGKLVVFESDATDLVAGDNNGDTDIFVRDRVYATTELVSVNTDGEAAQGSSENPSISADGRYVAFESWAEDLVEGDSNTFKDIFVRDLLKDLTTLVSVKSDGSQATGDSAEPSITTDEERVFVAYESVARDLVDKDSNPTLDVFISYFYKSNPSTVVTELVSRRDNGTQGGRRSEDASISGDGAYVAYESRCVLTGDDSLNARTIYVTDWDKDGSAGSRRMTTKMVSVQTGGAEITDRGCHNPSFSADGRYVVYETESQQLTGDADTVLDVFRTDWNHNPAGMLTEKVSLHSDGASATGQSQCADISADGRYVTFESGSSDLVAGDTNGFRDVFVRDTVAGVTYLVSTDVYGAQGDDRSGEYDRSRGPSITAALDGVVPEVSFFSEATNLVVGVSGFVADRRDVFVATTDTTPTITSISPTSGSIDGGETVYIYGTNFVEDTDSSAILFDGAEATSFTFHSTMKIIATTPAHQAGTVDVRVKAAGGESANTPGDDYTYLAPWKSAPESEPRKPGKTRRYEQDHEGLLHSGEWTEEEGDDHSEKSLLVTSDPEATITITFKGTQLDWIGMLGPNMGKALVSVDGAEAVLVDLYSDTELLQQVIWSTGLLAYGEHTVVITFPEGDDYVDGKAINVDAFDIYGAIVTKVE